MNMKVNKSHDDILTRNRNPLHLGKRFIHQDESPGSTFQLPIQSIMYPADMMLRD